MIRRFLVLLPLLAVAACAATEKAELRFKGDTKKVNETLPKASEPLPHIEPDNVSVVANGIWIGDSSFRRQRGDALPEVLDVARGVTLVTAGPVTLSEIARQIATTTAIPTRVSDLTLDDNDKEGQADVKMKVDWTGPATDLFNQVAGTFGVDWEHVDGHVRFFRYKTESFTLHAMPGVIRTDANVNSGITGSGGTSGTPGSSSSSSGGNSSQANSSASQQQITDANANLQVWADMKAAIENIIKGKGTATLSEATGIITIRSTPTVLRQAASFIAAQNDSLTRQVAVTVQVYSIAARDDDQYGVDINAIVQDLGRHYAVNLMGPVSGLGDPLGAINALIVDTNTRGALGRTAGSNAFLRALSTRGDTSLVSNAAATTLNGQPAPISIVTQTSYLAQVTVSQTVNAGTLQSLIPGTVTTGFNLTVLPRILDNGRLQMRYTLALSDLRNLRSISSGDQTIQVPEVDQRALLQHVMMRSGESLVLAGFEQKQSSIDKAGVGTPANIFTGGRNVSGVRRTAIVLVITPHILPPMNTRRPNDPSPPPRA